jgi:flagellar basal body-associated protein FliL
MDLNTPYATVSHQTCSIDDNCVKLRVIIIIIIIIIVVVVVVVVVVVIHKIKPYFNIDIGTTRHKHRPYALI